MSYDSEERGASTREVLPYIRSMGAVVDAARALLQGTGDEATLALKLREYDKEEQCWVPGPKPGKIAYEGLGLLSYPG